MSVLDNFWTISDGYFSFVMKVFSGIFSDFPEESIFVIIGIFSYIVACIMSIVYIKLPKSYRKGVLRIFIILYLFQSILFTMWRFGFINMIRSIATFEGMAELIVNMFWIGFFFILILAFIVQFSSQISWLRNLIHICLWSLLIAITYLIVPALSSYAPNSTTLTMTGFLLGVDLTAHFYLGKLNMKQESKGGKQ